MATLEERQEANFRMVSLLRDNLAEQQAILAMMTEAIQVLEKRIAKLERVTEPLPSGSWFDPRGGIS